LTKAIQKATIDKNSKKLRKEEYIIEFFTENPAAEKGNYIL